MNAQQLKNAILQEAIEGRLVPQDPNDEPASALLARIRKEKEQLVKAGKLKKKDLEVKPISEDEIPFDIPKSWEWVRLKSLVSVLGDGIHGTPEYDITGSYYFINGNNLSNNKIVIKADTKKVNEKEYQTYKKELNDKTILVSINGTIGNVGHYNGEPVILGKSACYYNLLDIRLKSYITMLMYTDYFLKYAVENATGSTIKNVSLAVMNDFLVPFPPVAEQHRIVAKIEELLPKIEEYGKAQDALNKLNTELPERLKKSILQEAIEGRLVPQDPNDEPASVLLAKIRKEKEQLVREGKLKKKDLIETPITEDEIPFEIPESWEWVKLINIGYFMSGQTPKTSDLTNSIGGVPYFKVSDMNVKGNEFYMNKATLFLRTDAKYKLFPQNAIIYPKNGGALLTNKKRILVTDSLVDLNTGAFIPSNELNIEYIFYLFSSIDFRKHYKGTALPTLNMESLNKLLFPLPPLAEQHRIVEKLEQLLGEIDKLKK
jgi:type I restriction enzyme S subunit